MKFAIRAWAILLLTAAFFNAHSQLSSYKLQAYAPITLTGTGQTSTPIFLVQGSPTAGASFTSANIVVSGTALATATFAVQGSSDNGSTYFPLLINALATPTTTATTATITAAGIYQVSLANIDHIRIVTSGTFTATNVVFRIQASPNGLTGRNGSGGGISPSLCNAIATGGGIPCVQALGTAQMVALYDFTPTGTTVGQPIPDQLGNAAKAIPWPVSNAPTQTQQGLVFDGSTTAILAVPAAVSGVTAFTAVFSQYGDNYQNGAAGSTYPLSHTLVSGSVVGGQGTFFAVNMNTGIGTGGKYYAQLFGGGNSNTQVWQPTVGPGMITAIPGSPDTIAVNDKFAANYVKQGNSGINLTGPYGIGANLSVGGRTFLGTISYVIFWSTAPTAAQVAALFQKISQILTVGQGGASLWRAQAAGAGPYLIACCDSHTAGSGAATWASTVNMPNLVPVPTIVVAASSGKHATEAVPELAEVFYENVPPTASQAAAIGDDGTNDILNSDMTLAQLQTFYAAYCNAAHKAGIKCIVQTYFDMCIGSFPGSGQSQNAWIRQHWREFADGISDVGADKILGVSGAACSGPNTYWDSSKYHLTNAGKTVEGLVPQAAWNNLWGSTISSPTTVTATASITSGQNFVQTTCALACTVTLPDATNNCGASFSVHSMGAGITSYAPAGTDTIDGSGSTVPMVLGQVISFTSQFNNNVAAPACAWAVTNN